MDEAGALVVAAARRWIGTPYARQASRRGAGCDCLGLVRGLWRELVGPEPESAPLHSPEALAAAGEELLLAGLARHVRPVAEARAGDLLVVRMREGLPAGHVGIRASDSAGRPTFIHAYSGRGVCESPLGRAWMRRAVAAFAFPFGS